MSFTQMTCYPNKDILIGNNNIEKYGFASTMTQGQMIDLAITNRCPILVKDGHTGKWYLKGQGKTTEFLKAKLDQAPMARDGVFSILIEF